DNSLENLKDISNDLRLKYFKGVHAISDRIIREIFAAKMAGVRGVR
ncbi:MAG: hypothetical protein HQL29_04210, partial [Candidatus Omnitrophica bacterium]|nr:hypothetical protein [Candidatus Omnitrophota bacterium]